MYFKEYLYNVTNKDKRNVNKVVVVFVEAVAIIMLTPGAHYLDSESNFPVLVSRHFRQLVYF